MVHGKKTPEKGYVLFETGYGPSGLPHIGTFGEVVRTSMVRQAFHGYLEHSKNHLRGIMKLHIYGLGQILVICHGMFLMASGGILITQERKM